MADRLKKINGRYYDIGTKNISFKKIAVDLQKLGVRNYVFMLEVKDPRVVNIDPYSPTITREQINIVLTECIRNIWYYLREIAMIPEQGGSSMHYSAHRGNIAQAWCLVHGYDSDLCIPRQCGKTQSAIALLTWAYLFGTTNSQTIFINKDGDASKANLSRLKDQLDLLPMYMRCEFVISDDDGKIIKQQKNATKMKHAINKNEIIIKGKANSQESALNIARGLSAPLLYFDEIEFTSRIDVIVRNSAPVYVTAAEHAKENHAIYGRIFTSTPGDLDTPAGTVGNMLVSQMPRWCEDIYNMSDEDITEYIKTHGENECDIFYIEYSYLQIGKDENWFSKISAKIGDPLTIKREVLLQRLRGSDNSPFDRDDLDYLTNNMHKATSEIILLNHYRFDVYTPLEKHIPYICGIDCSTGTNSDNNSITIINPYDLTVCAEFKCSYIGETKLCQLLIELVTKIIPNAILCIERNSVGDAIIDFLMNSKIASRLYYDRSRDLLADSIEHDMNTESILKKKAKEKSYVGVYTEGSSRESMMAILFRHVHEYKDKIYTENLVNDICSLIRRPSGKIEAASGKHDDCVMSYLIGLYVYYHGNNLAIFGFIKGSEEIEEQNQGLKSIESVNALNIVPQDIVESLKKEQELRNNSYEDLYAKALQQSQAESLKLSKAGFIDDSRFDNIQEDIFEDDSSISLDFIVGLNN